MAKEAPKQEIIRIRVTKEQKELFKEVANIKGITLTELLIVDTEIRAKKELDYIKNKETVEQRAVDTDAKLQLIKNRLYKKAE